MERVRFSLGWLPLLAAAAMAAVPVEAAPSTTNTSQSIVFSSPDNAEISSNVTADSSGTASSSFQTRLQLLQDSSPLRGFNSLPGSAAPPPMPVQVQPSRRSSDDRQPWEFMTPSEILGLEPPQDQQSQNRDINGNQTSLTPMERFLERQNSARLQRKVANNSSWGTSSFLAQRENRANNPFASILNGNSQNRPSAIASPFSANQANGGSFGNPNQNADWLKAFGVPSQPQVQKSVEQQEDMKQFMQLLNHSFTPAASVEAGTIERNPFKLQSFDSSEPLANPIGASIAPLSSSIGKPTGLMPLPSITQQPIQPVETPAWAPQPPPWLSSKPQPFRSP